MADSKVKITKEEMDRIKSENRHKEILKSLSNLLSVINSQAASNDTSHILAQNTQAIEAFIAKIGEITRPIVEVPHVTVETHQDQVVTALLEMGDRLSLDLKDLKQVILDRQNMDYEVDLNRDSFGRMGNPVFRAVKK